MHLCKAKRYGDQVICDKCGLQWDVNDPDPPSCIKGNDKRARSVYIASREMNIIKGMLKDESGTR